MFYYCQLISTIQYSSHLGSDYSCTACTPALRILSGSDYSCTACTPALRILSGSKYYCSACNSALVGSRLQHTLVYPTLSHMYCLYSSSSLSMAASLLNNTTFSFPYAYLFIQLTVYFISIILSILFNIVLTLVYLVLITRILPELQRSVFYPALSTAVLPVFQLQLVQDSITPWLIQR